MTAAVTYSLAPILVNSTVLPTANLRISPAVASQMHRNSGLEFASVEAVLGAAPKVAFSCPLAEAYATIGLKVLKITTLEVYLAKFVNAIRSSSSVHPKFALAASATGFAYIRSIPSVRQGSIAMAEVEIVLVSSDGQTHPLSASTGSLPTLAAAPALKTVGPGKLNGTTFAGTTSASVDLGQKVDAFVSDGDLYPRVCTYTGGEPVITSETGDPEALRSALGGGFLGAPLTSNFVQYFRDIDPTTQIAAATGMSFTVASGRALPTDVSTDNLALAKGGLRVECLSSDATHPVVVGTGASVPTP